MISVAGRLAFTDARGHKLLLTGLSRRAVLIHAITTKANDAVNVNKYLSVLSYTTTNRLQMKHACLARFLHGPQISLMTFQKITSLTLSASYASFLSGEDCFFFVDVDNQRLQTGILLQTAVSWMTVGLCFIGG